jgi:hypothetical protein
VRGNIRKKRELGWELRGAKERKGEERVEVSYVSPPQLA